MNRKRRGLRPRLECEQLEGRLLLSHAPGAKHAAVPVRRHNGPHAMLEAGDPHGAPPDSPDQRVDPNTPDSPFAGVGSIRVSMRHKTFICSGTSLDATHVLTAAHCLDMNNNGKSDVRDRIVGVQFNINLVDDPGWDRIDVAIPAQSWVLHPDYTGFDRPALNDDLAIITLASPLPAGVPTYQLYTPPVVEGQSQIVLVGYGRSGDALGRTKVPSSFTVKRVGENVVDALSGQDDIGKSDVNEVFRFDFDGPVGNGPLGGPTLGNTRETTLGGGDSGGPSFILVGSDPSLASSYQIVGVNTFTQGKHGGRFYSEGGGILVQAYCDWISTILTGP
jgi:secreted trypsin-like serine protease